MEYRFLSIKGFLITLLLLFPSLVSSQGISVNYYYQDVWNGWDGNNWVNMYHVYGNKKGYRIFKDGKQPADFFIRFWMTDYNVPSKKEIKTHYKNKQNWAYNGYVEYYICDVYPTLKIV